MTCVFVGIAMAILGFTLGVLFMAMINIAKESDRVH